MKFLRVGALLVLLVQATSLRLVCFEARGSGRAAAPAASAQGASPEASEACQRTCLRHLHPSPPRTAAPAANCALVPNPDCAALAALVTAVVPRGPDMVGPTTSRRIESTTTDDYLPPLLPRQSPPPKA